MGGVGKLPWAWLITGPSHDGQGLEHLEPIPKPLPSAFTLCEATFGRFSVASPRRSLRLPLRLAPSGPPKSDPARRESLCPGLWDRLSSGYLPGYKKWQAILRARQRQLQDSLGSFE
jgi:hypothetical protein